MKNIIYCNSFTAKIGYCEDTGLGLTIFLVTLLSVEVVI